MIDDVVLVSIDVGSVWIDGEQVRIHDGWVKPNYHCPSENQPVYRVEPGDQCSKESCFQGMPVVDLRRLDSVDLP